ncbi:MAG: ATP-dependent Clp protease ATP-binding subunit [Micavibrio aeruginosavorus]|uniref:ATP-dependent Clp protease ATP-binding subunit n=1 Tax=Micavibrio aeruginosavorus TaxID=349221 RepID=A0A7T5UHS6_9BACT|nr:MAG: ATP-dependent Clp protease ATP-binding subunit [Micavibrio aeruginosavorus]
MTDNRRFLISDDELEELIFKYCRDVTQHAREGRFDPITGRDDEIEQMILILMQKGRKNVGLLAPAGVGKTAVVAGLSQQIIAGNVPDILKNTRVLDIDLASMSAGTSGPAEFQGRFIPLCKGLAERYRFAGEYPRYIMFIDEMHTIMPTVSGSAYRGLSEVLKPYLTVGDLYVIGATTLDEFRMFVAVDPAMDRRFQKVFLKVPNAKETIQILMNLKGGYEKHHGITVNQAAVERIIELTETHMRKRNQPDKSIIVMDGAMAYHVMTKGTGGELSMDAINFMVSKEVGLHKDAL